VLRSDIEIETKGSDYSDANVVIETALVINVHPYDVIGRADGSVSQH